MCRFCAHEYSGCSLSKYLNLWYNTYVKKHSSRILLLATLVLTACFGESGNAPPSLISAAARKGALWSHEILMTGRVTAREAPRPSALLGPYVAAFLSLPLVQSSHAAISGVLAGTSILFDEGIRDESYALLEELGLVLQIDVQDMLNRSIDRQMALDTHRNELVDVAERSQEHLVLLEERQDQADTEVREVRRQASELQRALNTALRGKDYATASSLQAQVSDVQGQLAVSTAEQREIRSIINLFEESLELAAERVVALDANREALIAGVSVIDLPSSEDLGVLEEAERGQRRADPEDVFGPVEP